MSQLPVIFKRELGSYFATPLAYVFIVIFLVLSGVFTFYLGGFYERGQADLTPFFSFHTWLYLFLVPAIAMRLWAEERKSGSIELLMTLPITRFEAVGGKFLAAWVFAGIALLLTFPMVITVNYLGEPDNGVIVAGYLGSWLLAGAFLAIGSCMSALAKNQVIAFIHDTWSTVAWLRTSHNDTTNTSALPAKMAMFTPRRGYIFSMNASMMIAMLAPMTSAM